MDWVQWIGVIGSIAGIVSLAIYLGDRAQRASGGAPSMFVKMQRRARMAVLHLRYGYPAEDQYSMSELPPEARFDRLLEKKLRRRLYIGEVNDAGFDAQLEEIRLRRRRRRAGNWDDDLPIDEHSELWERAVNWPTPMQRLARCWRRSPAVKSETD